MNERCAYCHGLRSARSMFYIRGNYYCSMSHYREHNNLNQQYNGHNVIALPRAQGRVPMKDRRA